jgi:hypothetical protein
MSSYWPKVGDRCIIKEYPNDLHVIIEKITYYNDSDIFEIDFADNNYNFIKRKRFLSSNEIDDGKLIFVKKDFKYSELDLELLRENKIDNPGIVNPIFYPDYPETKEECERAFEILKNMCRGGGTADD